MLTNSATPLHKIIQVPFGIKDGILYEPRQVELGKACDCVCPECKRFLVAIHAKKGGQIPHFRHLPGNDCQHGLESAVHLAVKQLIAEQKKLYLPELIATISVTDAMGQTHSPTSIINQAGTHFFSSVRLEQWMIDFRPDLIANSPTDGDFLLEVAFTSFVNEQKLTKIKNQNIPLLQIDVSNFRTFNFESLSKVLFEPSTYISWEYHPSLAIEKEKLHFQLTDLLNSAIEIAIQNEVLAAEIAKKNKILDDEAAKHKEKLAKNSCCI